LDESKTTPAQNHGKTPAAGRLHPIYNVKQQPIGPKTNWQTCL
jgi:hypothetical protein